jgi:hypothetical protein
VTSPRTGSINAFPLLRMDTGIAYPGAAIHIVWDPYVRFRKSPPRLAGNLESRRTGPYKTDATYLYNVCTEDSAFYALFEFYAFPNQ